MSHVSDTVENWYEITNPNTYVSDYKSNTTGRDTSDTTGVICENTYQYFYFVNEK